jgi:hypothetical protein
MTERDPSLEPLDALIGTWATEVTHPAVDAVVPGTVTFEWWEGGHCLLGRSRNEHELIPDSIWVIGAPEAGEGLCWTRRPRGPAGGWACSAPERPSTRPGCLRAVAARNI